ncbi:MAG: formylglycine-generating enzyme family protein [Deltaproteobacteria bacterium]|nr:formylglycine-generating enzyme family protein [Deltaproteobacteria bacterium]
MNRVLHACLWACLPLLLANCALDPYCLDCEDGSVDAGADSGSADAETDAETDAEGGSADTGPATHAAMDGCVAGAIEICNGLDDDCDGMIDEGIDTSTDVNNCGVCGNVCAPAHAFGVCSASSCGLSGCDVGFFDRNGDLSDGCEVHCIATEPVETLCDLRDNNCDGTVDETFDLLTDPMNCGRCGRTCRFAHASASCVAGDCVVSSCDANYYDVDGVPLTGCEYSCTATGAETCNLRDDNCDGAVDEGDPGGGASCGSSVGSCGSGILHCVGGALTCEGATGPTPETCNGLDDDCDGTVDEGNPEGGALCGLSVGSCRPGTMLCTGGALVCSGGTGPALETCNGLDDNCDGTIDEGNPGGGASCGIATGACVAGMLRCSGGGLSCFGAVGPSLESCNGLDDDCDGVVDNGFDLTNDPRNCGGCGNTCAFPNAVATCAARTCSMGACAPGYVDRNGNAADGCEYACDFTGAEVCNGLDDDCDGIVDDGLSPPATFCNPNGVCAGTSPTCGGTSGWQCSYPAGTYEVTETRCDGLDNDCNGLVDDPFPSVGLACDNGALGTCLRTGAFVCDGAGTGVTCTAPAAPAPGVETCNNADDDCDGVVDNNAPANWVPITLSGGATRWVFQYEASRPDSTSTDSGSRTHRACSDPNRLPWTNVSPAEAAAACATVGGRLCSESEWQRACETPAGTPCTWSYQSSCTTYSGNTCNGFDNDVDPGTPGIQNGILATGTETSCYARWGAAATQRIYDVSGNAQEWTAPRSAGVNPMRGGSYNDLSGGTKCQFSFEVAGDTFRAPNVGFRCCRSTAP